LNDSPVGVDLPSVVELVITDTAPAMKGSSATSRTKPATLTTGLVVQVPEHISIGDRIKINVDESKFTGRA
jgi:elongation factor P